MIIALDVSKNTTLTNLDCGYNKLTNLDIGGATTLTYLYCAGNQLTNLDVSKNTALERLSVSGNQLSLKRKGLIDAELSAFGEVFYAVINARGKAYLEENKGFFNRIRKSNNINAIWTVIGVIGGILTIVMFVYWVSS